MPSWRFLLLLEAAANAFPPRYGLNVLDGKNYPHHPVMLQVPQRSYKIEPGLLTDHCGLKVPQHFDCLNLCNKSKCQSLGPAYNYYRYVPSRRLLCHEHQAYVDARLSHSMVNLPLIDDDYGEHVAVYQSVLRHQARHGAFRVVELGARWGTWGARAVQFLRTVKPQLRYEAFFVEPAKRSCGALRRVMKLNEIRFQLLCNYATPEALLKIMEGLDFVDLIHIDIQFAESTLLAHPGVQELLRSRAARIIVGSHSPQIHQELAEMYRDWIPIFSLPFGFEDCILEILRRKDDDLGASAADWAMVRQRRCFYETPQGGVTNYDGLLILDNPHWVDASKIFSMNDTDLRIDELKPLPEKA